jgi:hypothetical protein
MMFASNKKDRFLHGFQKFPVAGPAQSGFRRGSNQGSKSCAKYDFIIAVASRLLQERLGFFSFDLRRFWRRN